MQEIHNPTTFALTLDRDDLDNVLYANLDSVEFDNDTKVDDETYRRILDRAVWVSHDIEWLKGCGLALRMEYDNLLEAWGAFENAVLELAVNDVLRG